jgi:two-component system sensor histidine kinase KdpD
MAAGTIRAEEAADITEPDRSDAGTRQAAALDAAGEVAAAGRFRIYLGAAPGVGKTYAMLSEAHRRQDRGADVVVGFAESFGRPLTEALIQGLEVIPRKTADYRGSRLEEMDLEAVLARQPEVALVDELAHTNVPGPGRNAKRWQDVLDMLKAGIGVITTVNIQHLESIADEVEHMTGAKVHERVPDWVVHKADQIELIDSSPEQLRRRMLHGNIYPMAKVPQALTHFFRTDNLIALRELALRFVADESDEELLERLRQRQSPVLWETTERIMVAVTAEPGTDVLLRRAARIAHRLSGELDVVHINADQPGETRPMDALRALAADLSARWHDIEGDDPARALLTFARESQATQIMLGSIQHSWWHVAEGGPIVRRIIHEASAMGIDVHLIARGELPPAEGFEPDAARPT